MHEALLRSLVRGRLPGPRVAPEVIHEGLPPAADSRMEPMGAIGLMGPMGAMGTNWTNRANGANGANGINRINEKRL